MARAVRRIATLLLPGGSMNAGRFEFPDTTGYTPLLTGRAEHRIIQIRWNEQSTMHHRPFHGCIHPRDGG